VKRDIRFQLAGAMPFQIPVPPRIKWGASHGINAYCNDAGSGPFVALQLGAGHYKMDSPWRGFASATAQPPARARVENFFSRDEKKRQRK
jgi:hypothetical protein